MIVIKKSEIEQTLMHIAGFSKEGQIVSGLLSEEITLGMKRRLQKIHKDLVEHYQTFLKDKEEVEKCEDKQKELDELLSETVELNHEKISMVMIEAIKTKHNYNFEIFEKIAE